MLLGFFFQARPPGTISGRQLGEAAHRLVVNSLQVRANSNGYSDQMHGPPRSYTTTHEKPLSSFQNNRPHGHELNRPEAAMTGYPAETAQGHHHSSHLTTEQNQCGVMVIHASPTVQNPSSRSRHQHESDPYNRSYPRPERNNQSNYQNSEREFMDTTHQGSHEIVELGILHMVLVMFKLPLPFHQESISINMVDTTATETTEPMELLAIIIRVVALLPR